MQSHSSILEKIDTHTATSAEVCARFGISQPTLHRWTKNRPGFPKPLRLSSRMVRYDIAAIDRYLSTQSE